MTPDFKPMKAMKCDYAKLDYSDLWESPKIDGIRAVVINGVVMSKRLIPIPSRRIQAELGRPEFHGLEGELTCGPINSATLYNATYRGVMKEASDEPFFFHIFDYPLNHDLEAVNRLALAARIADKHSNLIGVLEQTKVDDREDLDYKFENHLARNHEGMMLRPLLGSKSRYKFGTATAKHGGLIKLKPLEDFEAQIVGYEEEMFNGNEATEDAFGNTKRSSHQENKVGKDTLGKLICRYEKNGQTFKVGIFKGMTAEDKKLLWAARETLPGQWVKLQKMVHGELDLPRHPRCLAILGLRSPIDL